MTDRNETALPLEDRYVHTYRCEACDGDGYNDKWVEDSDGRDYPITIPCSRCGGTGELRVDGKDDPS